MDLWVSIASLDFDIGRTACSQNSDQENLSTQRIISPDHKVPNSFPRSLVRSCISMMISVIQVQGHSLLDHGIRDMGSRMLDLSLRADLYLPKITVDERGAWIGCHDSLDNIKKLLPHVCFTGY